MILLYTCERLTVITFFKYLRNVLPTADRAPEVRAGVQGTGREGRRRGQRGGGTEGVAQRRRRWGGGTERAEARRQTGGGARRGRGTAGVWRGAERAVEEGLESRSGRR